VSESVIFELSGVENGGVGQKMRILSPTVLKLSRKYSFLVSNCILKKSKSPLGSSKKMTFFEIFFAYF
jgi:hypothetical protein